MAKRVEGFFTKMGGEEGPKCKIATHPLSPDAEQRRRPRGVGGGQSGRSGLGGAGDRGKRERGLWGTDPLPHLELGWHAEGGCGEPIPCLASS